MKLIQLQAFKKVLEYGSVTEASKNLKCSQPRVSRLISELEESIGFPLFVREKQRLHPTAEGMTFYDETLRFLHGIDNIEQIAEDICQKREARLRILTQSHIAHGLLSRVLGEFSKNEKKVRFKVVIQPRKELTKWLGGHQFDLAVTALPAKNPLVRQKEFVTIKLLVALPKDSLFTQQDYVSVEDLSTIPLIALSKGLPMRQRLEEVFDNAGMTPVIQIETPTVFSACQMVSQGLGATLTGPFSASLFSRDSFVLRPLYPEFIVKYGILYLKQEQSRPLVKRFAKTVSEVAEDINLEVAKRLDV